MFVVPWVAYYWWKIRQSELDASLKQEMLQRGMSAEEIQLVLTASSAAKCRKNDSQSATAQEPKNAEIRFENGAKAFSVKVSGGRQGQF